MPLAEAADRPPLKVPGPMAMPVPAAGASLRVDDFPGGLVPFVGDPKRSQANGALAQLVSVLAAVVMVLRVAPSLFVWHLARKGEDLSDRDVRRLVDSILTADDMRVPALVATVTVVALFVLFARARRPRAELAERGEAFVEASLPRLWPRSRRLAIVLFGAIGVGGALVRIVPDRSTSFDAMAWSHLAQALATLSLAVAFALIGLLVRAGDRHRQRRLAISVGLAPPDVPFVVPDRRVGLLGSLDRGRRVAGAADG